MESQTGKKGIKNDSPNALSEFTSKNAHFGEPFTLENKAPAAAGVKFSLLQRPPKKDQKCFQNGTEMGSMLRSKAAQKAC